jgi:hypothetical protein
VLAPAWHGRIGTSLTLLAAVGHVLPAVDDPSPSTIKSAAAALPMLTIDRLGSKIVTVVANLCNGHFDMALGGKICCACVCITLMSGPAAAEEERARELNADRWGRAEADVDFDSSISREEWKLRVDRARARSEQARQEWRSRLAAPFNVANSPEQLASERVLNDETLRPGDIVATDRGLLLYLGRPDADRGPGLFVPYVLK